MIRILTIDDSKAIHAYLGAVLEPQVATLTHAYDGVEGLEVLKSQGAAAFDLILLDWEMPKLTGIETLAKIRAAGFALPVIMLTSKNAPEDITRAMETGASEYVMKPIVSDILIAKIQDVLQRVA